MNRRTHILVIDDDTDSLELFADVLRDENYRVTVTLNAKIALASALQDPPDLILADWLMPDESGLEFAHAYYAVTAKPAPIIILTAAGDTAEAEVDPTITAVLRKPYDLNDLLNMLARAEASG